MRWRAVLYGFLLWLMALPGAAPAAGETVRLTNGEWPPYQGERLPLYGGGSAIITEAFALVSIDVEFGFFPWQRTLVLASRGEWDGATLFKKSPERERGFLFSDPVIRLRDVLFFHKDHPVAWESVEDLRGLHIGVTVGFYYMPEFENARRSGLFKAEPVRLDLISLQKVAARRLDAAVVTQGVGEYLLRHCLTSRDAEALTFSPKPLYDVDYSVLFPKGFPKSSRLCRLFNEGLKKLKASGRYEEILAGIASGSFDERRK